jgi:DNA-binding MarR family transcriptional regulator
MSQKQLAGLLEIDSTTLTRTLQPLRRAGWLRSTAGDDRREVHLALTDGGKARVQTRPSLLGARPSRLRPGVGQGELEPAHGDVRANRGYLVKRQCLSLWLSAPAAIAGR